MPDSIVLTPTDSGQTGVLTGHNLVSQVARIAGGEGEILIRAQALDCLNRARIEMNQYDWRFSKVTFAPITLVVGTRTYSLPTAFKKPCNARLIDSAGNGYATLVYRDDTESWRLDQKQSEGGNPYWYRLRNEFGDGLIDVYPVPGVSCAASYRLSVEYYQRFGAFSDTDVQLAMPEEATNVLVLGGQAYILREREKNSPVVAQAFADYQRELLALKTYDRRITDEEARFVIRPKRPYFDPTLYVRVS